MNTVKFRKAFKGNEKAKTNYKKLDYYKNQDEIRAYTFYVECLKDITFMLKTGKRALNQGEKNVLQGFYNDIQEWASKELDAGAYNTFYKNYSKLKNIETKIVVIESVIKSIDNYEGAITKDVLNEENREHLKKIMSELGLPIRIRIDDNLKSLKRGVLILTNDINRIKETFSKENEPFDYMKAYVNISQTIKMRNPLEITLSEFVLSAKIKKQQEDATD